LNLNQTKIRTRFSSKASKFLETLYLYLDLHPTFSIFTGKHNFVSQYLEVIYSYGETELIGVIAAWRKLIPGYKTFGEA
jgi:hypothetical protein